MANTNRCTINLATIATAIILLALFPACAAGASDRDSADNAALWYWRAFYELEQQLTDEVQQKIQQATGDPNESISDKHDKLLQEFDIFIGMADLASRRPYSDFAVNVDAGIRALMPHLTLFRQSNEIIELKTRRLLEQGHVNEAATLVNLLYRMSDHLRTEPALVSCITTVHILKTANALASDLEQNHTLSAKQRKSILDTIEELDPQDPAGIRSSMEGERQIVARWMIKHYAGDEGYERFRRDFPQLVSPGRGIDLSQEQILPARMIDKAQLNYALKEFERLIGQVTDAVRNHDRERLMEIHESVLRRIDRLRDNNGVQEMMQNGSTKE